MKRLGIMPRAANLAVHLGEYRDSRVADAAAVVNLLVAESAIEPWSAGDAVFVDLGAEPERWVRAELVDYLRDNKLGMLARKLERLLVPPDHVALLVVGEQGARVQALDISDLGPPRVSSVTPPPGPVTGAYEPGQPWTRGRWREPIPAELLGTNGRRRTP